MIQSLKLLGYASSIALAIYGMAKDQNVHDPDLITLIKQERYKRKKLEQRIEAMLTEIRSELRVSANVQIEDLKKELENAKVESENSIQLESKKWEEELKMLKDTNSNLSAKQLQLEN